MSKIFHAVVFVCGLVSTSAAFAQQEAGSGMDEIENLFSKDENVTESSPKPQATPSEAKPEAAAEAPRVSDMKEVSDLGKLQAFKDIAVIQKRFLPKTNRWEIYAAGSLNLNDAFFANFGGSLRMGYHFQERYSLEATATMLTVTERQVTTDLRSRNVNTLSFITPQSFYGLDFKWAPIYGKMTWMNKKITPFDLYFSFGGGITGTNQGSSITTYHLGSGQIFANSKATAFRWDFSWYMFYAKSSVDTSGNTQLYHNLLLSLGWSWFFPEATYR